MQKQHLTYDEIMAERSAGIPFPHLAFAGPRKATKQRPPHWKRTGHKSTRARWARQGRR